MAFEIPQSGIMGVSVKSTLFYFYIRTIQNQKYHKIQTCCCKEQQDHYIYKNTCCFKNLGDDADTVGAVAGGLAGIQYGMADISLILEGTGARPHPPA